jgi:hypothetical protein
VEREDAQVGADLDRQLAFASGLSSTGLWWRATRLELRGRGQVLHDGRIVRVWICWVLGTPLEDAEECFHDTQRESLELLLAGRWQGDELSLPCRIEGEEAIGNHGVSMGIELEEGAEPLDEEHRQGFGCPAGTSTSSGHLALEGEHLPDTGSEDLGQKLFVVGQPDPQGPGEAEHPLPVRRDREKVADQPRGDVIHSPTGTRGADRLCFAGERDQLALSAARALNAQKAPRQDAAVEIAAELALDMGGISGARLASPGLGKQCLGVLAYHLVEHGLVGPAASVARWSRLEPR